MSFLNKIKSPFTQKEGLSPGDPSSTSETLSSERKTFGTFSGVFIPNITMMFGVILFLRLGLVISNIGPFAMTLMVFLAMTIMTLTSLSITAIVTNMRVGAGGVYYLVSRSLGLELGGAIGLALYLSQIISVVMCTSGFAYSLQELFPSLSVSLIEFITLCCLTLLTVTSADLALKTQLGIFFILVISIICILNGSSQKLEIPQEITPYFPNGLGFWAAFSIFFPAMTGIEAGMAMSGTLKTPARSLSIGNFASILLAACTYLGVALYIYSEIPLPLLQSNSMILIDFGAFKPLIYLGIWGATLSSALGGLLGAPRMLQMIAEDGIILRFLAKKFGPSQEPRYAVLASFMVSLLLMYYTSMDQIIPILSMICLISYTILNLVACFCELINSPSWRPAVRSPWVLSACGASLSLFTMFMIDAGWTFTSFFLVVTGYFLLRKRQMKSAFSDIRKSLLFYFAKQLLYKLSQSEQEAIHWRPQLLVFVATPQQSEKLVHLSHELTRRSGILTLATLSPDAYGYSFKPEALKRTLEVYYKKAQINCLVETVDFPTIHEGIQNLVKCYGIGPLHPNTIVMGLPQKNETAKKFIPAFRNIQNMKKNLILFRDQPKIEAETFIKPSKKQARKIDIWWDLEHRNNFELILSYLTTLTDNQAWKNCEITLRTMAPDEQARRNLQDYFLTYFSKNRLQITAEIYVDAQKSDPWIFLGFYSQYADLLLIPLRSLAEFSSDEDYIDYLGQIRVKLKHAAPTLLITRYDDIEHSELYRLSEPTT